MKKNLILDGNNILYRTFHANNKSGEPNDVIIAYCIMAALTTMNKYFKMFEVDDVIVAFDSYSWRKEFTKDLSKRVSNKKYKAHRREKQSPKEKELYCKLDEHIDQFYEILKEKTGVLVLRRYLLEGDDLMAAYVQMHRDDENIVVSGDKDMMQLLKYDGVKVINPANDEERSLSEWNHDAGLFLFEKFIRGEAKTNDNIQSSYPRLRRVKLFKAYEDEFERTSIMNHTFTQLEELSNGEYGDVEYSTQAIFDENKILMDLSAQPKGIKKEMVRTILEAKDNRGKYNHIKFLRFLTINELEAIINRIEEFVPMLTVR